MVVLVLSIFRFLVDPLNVLVFVGCGLVAANAWIAVAAGTVYGFVIFLLVVGPNVAGVNQTTLLVYLLGSIIGVLAVHGLKIGVLKALGRH